MESRHTHVHPSVTTDQRGLRNLERARGNNDQKLKSRFEDIFQKYERDFTGVGDEIDISSGTIVVDNGHLQHMRHEVDPGNAASSRFLRTFQRTLEHEDELSEETDESSEDDEFSSNADAMGTKFADEDVAGSSQSEDGVSDLGLKQALKPFTALGEMGRPAPRLAHFFVNEEKPQPVASTPNDDDNSSSIADTAPVENMLEQIPSVHERMRTNQAKGRRKPADEEMIQALGASIANQLAELMAGSSKRRKKKPREKSRGMMLDPVWDYPEIRRGTTKKRGRSASPVADQAVDKLISPVNGSPNRDSLWAPSGSTTERKRRQLSWSANSLQNKLNARTADHLMSSSQRTQAATIPRCWNCSLTRSSTRFQGPHGQDLCDSCGKYYEHHGRMKPFDSPTPSVEHASQDEDALKDESGNAEDLETRNPRESAQMMMQRPETSGPHQAGLHTEEQQIASKEDDDADSAENQLLDFPTLHVEPHQVHTRLDDGSPNTLSTGPSKFLEQPFPAGYSANTSRPMFDSTSARRRNPPYTPAEDALIIKLKEHDRLAWDKISGHFPNRSCEALQNRYSSCLRRMESAGRQLLAEQVPVSTIGNISSDLVTTQSDAESAERHETLVGGQFSTGNNALIVEKRGRPTKLRVPVHAPSSGAHSDVAHISVISRTDASNSAAANHSPPEIGDDKLSTPSKFPRYTDRENERIIQLVDQGLRWREIAKLLPGRTVGSLQVHWSVKLKHTAGRSLPTKLPSKSRREGNDLLRRAVDNQTRRRTVHETFVDTAFPDSTCQASSRSDDSSLTAGDRAEFADVQLVENHPYLRDSPENTQNPIVDVHCVPEQASSKSTSSFHSLDSSVPSFEAILSVANRSRLQQTRPDLYSQLRDVYDRDPDVPRMYRFMETADARSANLDDIVTTIEHMIESFPQTSRSATASLQSVLNHGIQTCSDVVPQANATCSTAVHKAPTSLAFSVDAISPPQLQEAFEPERVLDASPIFRRRRSSALRSGNSGNSSSEQSVSQPDPSELSFGQLLEAAFEAQGQPLDCDNIYAWVENNFEFYRLSPPSWRVRLRAELSRNPSFERTTFKGEVAWQLAEDAARTEHWGMTRGPRRKHVPQPPMSGNERLTVISGALDGTKTADVDDGNETHSLGEDSNSNLDKVKAPAPEKVLPSSPTFPERTPAGMLNEGDKPRMLSVGKLSKFKAHTFHQKGPAESTIAAVHRSSGRPTTSTTTYIEGSAAKAKSARNPASANKTYPSDLGKEEAEGEIEDELCSPAPVPISEQRLNLPSTPSPMNLQSNHRSRSFVTPAPVSVGLTQDRSRARIPSHDARNSPAPIFVYRSSPLARRSKMRVAHGPLREVDSDEDELA